MDTIAIIIAAGAALLTGIIVEMEIFMETIIDLDRGIYKNPLSFL
jgi:hypothetical protein